MKIKIFFKKIINWFFPIKHELTPKGISLLEYLESDKRDNEYYEDFLQRFRDHLNKGRIERGEEPIW